MLSPLSGNAPPFPYKCSIWTQLTCQVTKKTPLLRAESGRTEGSLAQPNLAKGRKLRPLPSTTMYSYVVWIIFELILFFIRALTCIVCDVSTSTIWTSFHLSCWWGAMHFKIFHLHLHHIPRPMFQHLFPCLWLGLKILHLHRFTCNCRYGSKPFTCTCLIPRFSFPTLVLGALRAHVFFRICALGVCASTSGTSAFNSKPCCSISSICTWCCFVTSHER